jgi:hypothetical protein
VILLFIAVSSLGILPLRKRLYHTFIISLCRCSCGVPFEKHTEEIANTLEMEVDDTEPLPSETPESKTATSNNNPGIMSENIFNNGYCAILGYRILFLQQLRRWES